MWTIVGILLLIRGLWGDGRLEEDGSWRWTLVGPFGGEARRLAVDPHNPRRVWVGTCGGQLYVSSDGGERWTLVRSFRHPGFCISEIVVDRDDSRTMYVAGWHLFVENGGGIYRSRDGGQTWHVLPGTETHAVRALAQAPSDPRVLVFGALDGVFRSDDRGESWRRISPLEVRHVESVAIDPRSDRIFYVGTWHLPWKTTDGGRTWVRAGGRETGLIDDSEIFRLVIDGENSDRLWLSACTGIYRSEDGGRRWVRLRTLPPRRVLAVAWHPRQREVLFAGTTEGLWRSGDGGATWRLITFGKLTVHDIALHPDDPNRVLLATEEAGVLVSQDQGVTFRPSNHGFSSWIITSVVPDPEIRGRLYCGVMRGGAEGGFFISDDGGRSWRAKREIAGVRAIVLSPRDGRRMYLVGEGGLFLSEDRGESWQRLPSPDRSTSRDSSDLVGTSSWASHMRTLGVLRLEEGREGDLWALTSEGVFRYGRGRWARVLAAEGREFTFLYIGRSGRVWVGVKTPSEGRLMVSSDGGVTWEDRAVPTRLGNVHVFLEHPEDSRLLFAGTPFGLYRSQDDGRNWERCSDGLPHADVLGIALHPADSRRMMITDYRTGALYLSEDRGQTWRRIELGDEAIEAWGAAFDPHDGGRIFLASRGAGVYVGERPANLVKPGAIAR